MNEISITILATKRIKMCRYDPISWVDQFSAWLNELVNDAENMMNG